MKRVLQRDLNNVFVCLQLSHDYDNRSNVYRRGRPNMNDINSGRETRRRDTSLGVIACWLLLHIIALQLQMHRNLITTRHDVSDSTIEGANVSISKWIQMQSRAISLYSKYRKLPPLPPRINRVVETWYKNYICSCFACKHWILSVNTGKLWFLYISCMTYCINYVLYKLCSLNDCHKTRSGNKP